MVITEKQQIKAEKFRRRIKSTLAGRGDTITALAGRIKYPVRTVSAALTHCAFPHVIAAIEADLFGKTKRSPKPKGRKFPKGRVEA